MIKRPAVFFDRDGVLIRDVDLLNNKEQVRLCDGVCRVLGRLQSDGYLLFVATNQTVVARGLSTIEQVIEINEYINDIIGLILNTKPITKFFICPHHPQATLEQYRQSCNCRKPAPGMLFAAAQEYGVDLGESYMVGDRMSDVVAGSKAGCKTILVRSDKTDSTPIISAYMDYSVAADHVCDNLLEAYTYIEKNGVVG